MPKGIDRVEISSLLDLYGELLSEKQRFMLELYYNEDLSLAEISENVGITRQGVRDAVAKATSILEDIEAKLGFLKKNKQITELARKIVETSSDPEAVKAASDILAI